MKVREIMKPARWTLDEEDTLGRAERMLVRRRLRQLFVLSAGRLTGILAARDILAYRTRAAGNGGWQGAPIRRAMQPAAVTAVPDEEVDAAVKLLTGSPFDELPVVEQGLLVGVVSATDVLDAELAPLEAPELLVVADAMSEPAIAVAPTDRLLEAVKLMVDHQIRHLPVVENGAVVGVLSDRDVRTIAGDPVRFLEARDSGGQGLSVRDAMTRSAVTVRADRPLDQLAGQLVEDKVGAVPVVDRDGKLVGIVSYVDLLRAMAA